MSVHTLLIDNHDSFTFNLFQLLAEVNGRPPTVVRNDTPWSEVDPTRFDNIVISPGPGHPGVTRDVGISIHAFRDTGLPLLGVCLGHQLLCHLLGGRVGHAVEPVHGRTSAVHHRGTGLFDGIPSGFRAVRYHSLAVTAIPNAIEVTGWTDDDVVMAVRQRGFPRWGVQFHPESILTEHGRRLIENLRALTLSHHRRHGPDRQRRAETPAAPPVRSRDGPGRFRARHRTLGVWTDPTTAFVQLFGDSSEAFWLDSSAVIPGRSRFSFMGDASGPLAELVTYDVRRGLVTTRGAGGSLTHPGPLLDHLDRRLRERRVPRADLPFQLGYVGYLGYELKAECGGRERHRADTPDAAMVFADRVVAFDHREREIHLLCLVPAPGGADWIDRTSRRLSELADVPEPPPRQATGHRSPTVPVTFRHRPDEYLDLIAECQREIRDGESYEICLTNTLRAQVPVDPLRTYLLYRRANPAPYGAFLRFGDLAVLSASPERFLRVTPDGTVESEPIKGTRPRGRTASEDRRLAAELRGSVKDRAENLMIVDLTRNDVGAVCEIGSVRAPRLFDVESYATMHQLVSTVRGALRSDATAVDAVRSAFPGGSMTGAPKKRTMEIIDRLEAGPRGVYSGALGYLGLDGAADLSIVIRTMVVTSGGAGIGVGGAIVALSDPRAELEEAMLKGRAALDTLAAATHASAVR
ncbi:MAG: aminodeoxychorismate synthase component I [Actinobacteria bacterium]|nr:aminodeoxychorismate synthase component I [Actinomycetota bacterium]